MFGRVSKKTLTTVKCTDHSDAMEVTHLTEQRRSQMSTIDLTGRVALVTGGAQGLGEGMASALAVAGATVMIADVQESAADTAAALGKQHRSVQLDVTDDAAWERAVGETVDRLGGLDIVVNNAGVEITSLLTEVDPADVQRMLSVNILGTALGVKHGLRAMRPGGPAGQGGSIINIASVAATIAFPGIGIYSATKSAVDRLTRVAAMESGALGFGVRVNCVYPGLVPTEMGAGLANDVAEIGLFESPDAAVAAVIAQTPGGRLGTVEDMADAVVFLASDAAKFITGAGLPVDGGMGM